MTDHAVPPIGMRMVKTAAAVLICLLVSMVVDREDMRIYSSIAALLCVQPYAEDTKRMAIQRTVGTAIGSVFGIATLLLEMALDIRGTLVGYVLIAAGRAVRDLLRFGDEVVGGIALRRDHDDDVVARVAGVGHDAGHVEDAAAVLDRSTAEFLYDQCHWLLSSPLPHS